jgi:uncharacterized protein
VLDNRLFQNQTQLASARAPLPLAVVTGASSGIGAAFARLLARRGHPIALVGRDPARLAALVGELPVAAHVVRADLTDPDELSKVESFVRNPPQPVGLLINNAGAGWWGPFAEHRTDLIDATVKLNTLALTRLVRAVLPGMIAARSGRILNVSSLASVGPQPDMALYAATKAFVDSFTTSLRRELTDTGVRVTCVRPSWVLTDFHVRSTQNTDNVTSWLTPQEVAQSALRALDLDQEEVVVANQPSRLVRLRGQMRGRAADIAPEFVRRGWRTARGVLPR